MESKRCFTCKEVKDLDDFLKLPEKDYKLPSDKGCSTECRECTFNRIVRDGEKLHPYRKFTKLQGELRRFTSIKMCKTAAFLYCFVLSDKMRRDYLRKKLEQQGLVPYNELEL